jgi:hypothetical protein
MIARNFETTTLATIPQNERGRKRASGLFDPRLCSFSLEDPHDDGPQEYEDTAYSENL